MNTLNTCIHDTYIYILLFVILSSFFLSYFLLSPRYVRTMHVLYLYEYIYE